MINATTDRNCQRGVAPGPDQESRYDKERQHDVEHQNTGKGRLLDEQNCGQCRGEGVAGEWRKGIVQHIGLQDQIGIGTNQPYDSDARKHVKDVDESRPLDECSDQAAHSAACQLRMVNDAARQSRQKYEYLGSIRKTETMIGVSG
jgi:hypothetical protein